MARKRRRPPSSSGVINNALKNVQLNCNISTIASVAVTHCRTIHWWLHVYFNIPQSHNNIEQLTAGVTQQRTGLTAPILSRTVSVDPIPLIPSHHHLLAPPHHASFSIVQTHHPQPPSLCVLPTAATPPLHHCCSLLYHNYVVQLLLRSSRTPLLVGRRLWTGRWSGEL